MLNKNLLFTCYPQFAGFMVDKHLDAFAARWFSLAYELDISFLKSIEQFTEDKKISILKDELSRFLNSVSQNKATEYINQILGKWHQGRLEWVQVSDIMLKDIKLYNYATKSVLLGFVTEYTSDVHEMQCLIGEMDIYFLELEQSALTMFVRLLDGRLAVTLESEMESRVRLAERERQLLEAQELGGMGSYDWNLLTGRNDVTPQLEKILGVETGSSLKEFLEKVHPVDKLKVKNAITKAIRTTGNYDLDFRIQLHGEEKVLWSRGIVISKEGNPVSLRGTLIDVTEKHQLLMKFKKSEDLYKEAQKLAVLGNWIWDFKTGAFEWSDGLYHIFNIEPFSVKMNPELLDRFIHPEDRQIRQAGIEEAIALKKSYSIYYRIILDNGEEKVIHSRGSASYDQDGNIEYLLGTAQDVTSQKKIEQQLVDQQMFIKMVADSTPAIIASYDVNANQFSFINRGINLILGYEQAAVMKQGIDFLFGNIHPEDLKNLIDTFNSAVANANETDISDSILELKFRIRNSDGHYRWMSCFGTILDRNKRGKVKQILTISFDDSSRVEAEKKILRQTLELQQSNASLEEFAHVASHDLKEPLRKISNFADRLLTLMHSDSPNAQEYLKKIIDSAMRMQLLIDDLLSVSVISTEKSFKWYPLKKIIDDVLQSLELKIEEKKADIKINLDFRAYIVPSQFRQLFQNLLLNSLKFTRKDAHPEIEISGFIVSPWAVKEFPVKAAESYLQIRIADSGIGFEPQFAQQIFAIFQRLHVKSQYEGTGIGLAICKKIVENHGGVIFANGQKDKGAVFTIILPLAEI